MPAAFVHRAPPPREERPSPGRGLSPLADPPLQLAGYQPLSLLDYPGKLAAVLFCQGCNLSCPYCHNPQLVTCVRPARWHRGYDPEGVLADLDAHAPMLDGVVLTGGEATLQPGLPAFLKQVRAKGLAIKLDTNGTRPALLKRLLDQGLVDYVAMDIKAPLDQYEHFTGQAVDPARLEASIQLLLDREVPHEFRTTLVAGDLDEAALQAMAQAIAGGQLYRLQTFRPVRTLDATYAQRQPVPVAEMEALSQRLCHWVPTVVNT